jgi:STAM-binding protein
MDEEELVLQFTEERSLITLGWVGLIFTVIEQEIIEYCIILFRRSIHIPHNHVRFLWFTQYALLNLLPGFMSSVDLHTHSGFQRMLPESFAVVCAPKSNPKYDLLAFLYPHS